MVELQGTYDTPPFLKLCCCALAILPQVAQVERLNAELIAAQKALHDDLVEEIQQRNQERLLAAREAYEAAHDAWIKVRPSRGQVFIQYLDPCIYKCTAHVMRSQGLCHNPWPRS